eukprot:1579707-Amphidinium_carterae.1
MQSTCCQSCTWGSCTSKVLASTQRHTPEPNANVSPHSPIQSEFVRCNSRAVSYLSDNPFHSPFSVCEAARKKAEAAVDVKPTPALLLRSTSRIIQKSTEPKNTSTLQLKQRKGTNAAAVPVRRRKPTVAMDMTLRNKMALAVTVFLLVMLQRWSRPPKPGSGNHP